MKTKENLAVIYEPISLKKGILIADSVALVDYNKFTGNFTIKHGVYEGLTNKDFNIIKGGVNFIHGRGHKVHIERFLNNNNDMFIYIFDNRDLNNMKETLGVTRYETYLYIAEHVFETALLPYEFKLFTTTYRSMLEPADARLLDSMLYNEETIYEQLYGEPMPKVENRIDTVDKNSDSEENNIGSISVYKLDANTGELKEVDINDLPKALPISLQNKLGIEEELEEEKEDCDIDIDIDIANIIKDVESKIVGQDEAITTLVTNIYYNQRLIEELEKNSTIDEAELDSRKVNILIDGSTGTGKTAMAKMIASKFDLPLVITNANSFSETGYVGPTITDMLKKLIEQTDGDVKKAEHGIIVLDEIDKIAVEKDYGHNMKKGVQEELLSFIGGGKYDIKMHDQFGHPVTFDTSKITFVLMGAFTEIRENKIKKQESNPIGFSDKENKDKSYTVTPQDYIDYGLMREFFGRIKVLTSTKTYSKEDLTKILLTSDISPLKNFEKNAQMFGYGGISYEEEFIKKIVDEAYEMKTGARGLQTILSGIQNKLLLEMVTNNVKDENKKLELNEEILASYKKAKIIKY